MSSFPRNFKPHMHVECDVELDSKFEIFYFDLKHTHKSKSISYAVTTNIRHVY